MRGVASVRTVDDISQTTVRLIIKILKSTLGDPAERPGHMPVYAILGKERKEWLPMCRAGGNRCIRCVRCVRRFEVVGKDPCTLKRALDFLSLPCFPTPRGPEFHVFNTVILLAPDRQPECQVYEFTAAAIMHAAGRNSVNPSFDLHQSFHPITPRHPFCANVCSIAEVAFGSLYTLFMPVSKPSQSHACTS